MFRRPARPAAPITPTPGIRFIEDPPPPPKPAPSPTPPPAKRRREFPIGTAAFLAVLVGGGMMIRSGHMAGSVDVDEDVRQAFPVTEAATVEVETFNGPIEVARGDGKSVECVVVKRGRGPGPEAAHADLEKIDVTMAKDGETIKVLARKLPGGSHGSAASVRLSVPEGSTVRLKTGNGAIEVAGVEGPVEAHTGNGKVQVRDGLGRLTIDSGNGDIECEASEAVVVAETGNGTIDFDGSLAGGKTRFESGNGRVTIKLPEGQDFRIDASSGNGRVGSDFDVEKTGRSSSRHLVGTVGEEPKTDIKVRTGNGRVRIVSHGD